MRAPLFSVCLFYSIMLYPHPSHPPLPAPHLTSHLLSCTPSPSLSSAFSQSSQWELERTLAVLHTASSDAASLDDWELDPNHIFVREKLGEGSFGEVYLARLTNDVECSRARKYVEDISSVSRTAASCSVAIKLLKGEASKVRRDGEIVEWLINATYCTYIGKLIVLC